MSNKISTYTEAGRLFGPNPAALAGEVRLLPGMSTGSRD